MVRPCTVRPDISKVFINAYLPVHGNTTVFNFFFHNIIVVLLHTHTILRCEKSFDGDGIDFGRNNRSILVGCPNLDCVSRHCELAIGNSYTAADNFPLIEYLACRNSRLVNSQSDHSICGCLCYSSTGSDRSSAADHGDVVFGRRLCGSSLAKVNPYITVNFPIIVGFVKIISRLLVIS